MAGEREVGRPLEVSCIDLDDIRRQVAELDYVVISTARPLTPARRAVLNAVTLSEIRLELPGQDLLEIPIIDDPKHQQMIYEAKKEESESSCWWRKVGTVVVDPTTNQIVVRDHNDPVGEGNFCKGLEVDYREVIKQLEKGERLEFCHARHDVPAVVGRAVREGIPLVGKRWYGTLEHCDHCANLLVGVDPESSYLEFNPAKKYYNSLGLKILQKAGVPVYFVRMPENG